MEILAIDDDVRLLSLLQQFLTTEHFIVHTALDTAQARLILNQKSIRVIVLDLMLPNEDGISFLRTLSKNSPPVLLLTAKDTLNDKILGFETGAADYLTKPFEPKELSLRIRSLGKRSLSHANSTHVALGVFRFDKHRKELYKNNIPIPLSSTECMLLTSLIEKSGYPCSREQLVEKTGYLLSLRTIDSQIARLRKKLEDTKDPLLIRTVRHLGYAIYPR